VVANGAFQRARLLRSATKAWLCALISTDARNFYNGIFLGRKTAARKKGG
jgi:hypothetical protein